MKKKHQIPVQNGLISALQTKDTVTKNGAISHSTTGVKLLDFFGKGGAMRGKSEQEVTSMFRDAFAENKDLALKILFYLADVREGQGERQLFRYCFKWLISNDVESAKKLLKYIPEFTRWDNVLETCIDTSIESDAFKLIVKQLKEDVKSETPSLCGKWCPSEQASSKVTKNLAYKLRSFMEFTPKQYRKMLSSLREKIGIVERQMCAGKWTEINYEAVPSKASTVYRKAFSKHDATGYVKYLSQVEKGEKKINASVLYPYDICRRAMGCEDRTLDAQWSALPDYLKDNPHNGLVVADVSGSMDSTYGGSTVRPVDVAVSLALYFSERNVGAFKDHFMIFSNYPKLLKVTGSTIHQKIRSVLNERPVANTNLQAVFDLVLTKAVQSKVPESEMPKTLYVVSDMEFDRACSSNESTNFEVIKEKYKNSGYVMPSVVFWNVNSGSQTPIRYNDKGVCLVSGCSPVVLKNVMDGKVTNPWDMMISTVQTKRYQYIVAQ